jgi:hypothetical protein
MIGPIISHHDRSSGLKRYGYQLRWKRFGCKSRKENAAKSDVETRNAPINFIVRLLFPATRQVSLRKILTYPRENPQTTREKRAAGEFPDDPKAENWMDQCSLYSDP